MADRPYKHKPFLPPKLSHADLVEAAIRFAREGGAGFDTDAERNVAELGARRAISLMTKEEGFYDQSFVPDSFELIVADCLPDDDDGGEEPGAMCKRALAKAEASGSLIKQVAILVSGADDLADFERTYGEEDQRSIHSTAFEIIKLVRATPVPGQSESCALHGIAIDRVIDSAVGHLDDIQIREAREDLRRLREGRRA